MAAFESPIKPKVVCSILERDFHSEMEKFGLKQSMADP
jgi:hypothetical protein